MSQKAIMSVGAFADTVKLTSLSEVNKATHLAYYFLKAENVEEFTATQAAVWFDELNLSSPNKSRLTSSLKGSRDTIRGKGQGSFKLQSAFLKLMDAAVPQLLERSQEITDLGTILPSALYKGTRGYLEQLAAQINVTYEHNAFDGCAVLMRRLTEVLLILAYEHLGIGASIKDSNDNYLLLEGICNDAKRNSTLSLSRNSKTAIEVFRQLGNFSAHKITYTCKREYIQQEIMGFRALADELLHKAGILK